MEQVHKRGFSAQLVELKCSWSDLGSWDAVWRENKKDANGNVFLSQGTSVDSENSYVRSDGKFIALVGVRDMVVVEGRGGILVGSRHQSQKVKEVAQKVSGSEAGLASLNEPNAKRGDGNRSVLAEQSGFKINRISIDTSWSSVGRFVPSKFCHYVVVEGKGAVATENEEFILLPGQSFFVSDDESCEVVNVGSQFLEIIEIEINSLKSSVSKS
jgi:mannose-1-phosphate guanylyltransferase/mannose-6-phosphate isomerase